MNISEERKTELYKSISDPIMKNRISINNSVNVLGKKNVNDIDLMLFKLTDDIWKEIKLTLNIKE